jgi:glucose/arabinose dehydrogenase
MSVRRAAVAAVTAVLTLAACADDDTSAPTPTAGTPSSPAPTTGAVASTTPGTTGTTPPSSTPGSITTTTPPPMTGREPAVTFTEIGTFDSPVDLAWRTGDEALYVVGQGGTVTRFADGVTTTVLDLSDRTEANGEQGLLGLTFSPDGRSAYVDYTDLDGNTVIAEHAVTADGTFAPADEARVVLTVEQPHDNHNGGDLTFGPDGMLYIGLGDGGGSGDPDRRATDLGDLLGKVLRIDPTPSGDRPYTVPADNPFVDDPAARPEIWASGLRNPWRFSFDRATGDLWVADVGQNAFEEITVAPATDGTDAGRGESFGWSALEGNAPYNDDVAIEDPVPPIFTYENPAQGCSVAGGVRVRGGPVPDLVGWYVYGDFCANRVWALEVLGTGFEMTAGRLVELGELASVTAVADGPDGEVYALSLSGPVVRLDPT